MKQSILHKLNKLQFTSLFVLLLFVLPATAISQTDSTAVAEESSLISPSIDFTSVQKTEAISLKVAFSAKVNGAITKLKGYKIEFFAGTDSGFSKIGEALTDKTTGIAEFNYKADLAKNAADGKLHFKVSYEGNQKFEAAEEELTFKRGRIEITPVKEDSVYSVQLKLVDISTGTETVIPETDLVVMIKRMFKPMKIGEGKTDETGLASIEVPGNLPGDEKGNITILARLDENEEYGNIEAEVTQQWGIAVSNLNIKQPRALWSAHPPIWMLVTFIILMTTVWGHYFFIIYELFRLKKEHE